MEGGQLSEEESLRAALGRSTQRLLREKTAARHARKLVQAIDVLAGSDTIEEGIGEVLRLCKAVTGAECAVLLRGTAAGEPVTVLESARAGWPPRSVENAPWIAAFLSRPQRVADLEKVPLPRPLPKDLEGQRSLVSALVPVRMESPLSLVLLSPREDAFSRRDHVFLRRVARVLEEFIDRIRLARRATALARVVDGKTDIPIEGENEFDATFTALRRAYSRAAEWQGKIIAITDELLTAQSGDVDRAVNEALANTGRLADVDRTYVFRLRDPDRLDNTHEWCADGIAPMIDELQDMPDSMLDDWRSTLVAGLAVEIPDVAALPEQSVVREVLLMQGIQSLLAVPMRSKGRLTGFVGYDAVKAKRSFLPMQVQLIHSVANAINVLIERAAAEAAAEAAMLGVEAERDRLQATLSALPDLVLELDAEGRFVSFNAGAQMHPFLPPEQFIGRMAEDVLPDSLHVLLRQILNDACKGVVTQGYEYPLEIDGEQHWFHAKAARMSKRRQEAGFVVLIRDITEQREQHRVIARLAKFSDVTSNLVIAVDNDLRIEWINAAMTESCGWTLEELAGQSLGDSLGRFITDETAPAVLLQAISQGEPVRTELMCRSRKGKDYWLRADISPIQDDTGARDGFIVVMTDITEIKESYHEALQDRAMAIEGSNDGIAMLDAARHFVYANRAYRETFGLDEFADISGIVWEDLFTAEAGKTLARARRALAETGRWRGQLSALRRDGEVFPLEISATKRDDGALFIITRDISETTRLEAERARMFEELQLAQRRETVAHLAAGIAHDLNNVVAVVSGSAELLETESADNPAILASTNRIKRATQMASDLARGLAQLGRRRVRREEQDLRDLLTRGTDLLGTPRIARHRITVSLSEARLPVWADSTELLQVFANLALNACESDSMYPAKVTISAFSDNGWTPPGEATIGTWIPGEPHAIFTVTDTGPGMEEETIKRLFEPYFTTKGQSGTGLGMPIVATILRDSGGKLWVHSVPGSGTTITVAWPAKPEVSDPEVANAVPGDSDAGAEADDATCTGAEALAGCMILVVDDAPDFADLLSEMLEDSAAVSVAVSDPLEARDLLLENPGLWSALVTDLHMPHMGGNELAQVAAGLTPPVPTILITAMPDTLASYRAPYARVQSKPVNRASFVRAVCEAVKPGS